MSDTLLQLVVVAPTLNSTVICFAFLWRFVLGGAQDNRKSGCTRRFDNIRTAVYKSKVFFPEILYKGSTSHAQNNLFIPASGSVLIRFTGRPATNNAARLLPHW